MSFCRCGTWACTGLIGASLVGFATFSALSEEPPKEKDAKPAVTQPAEMDPMMVKMIEAGTPGEHHKELAAMAGTFDVEVKWWMDPTSEPQVSKGSATNELVYSGRYLHMKFKGDPDPSMPEGMNGEGYFGYDNSAKKHFATWIDSMSTGIAYASGTCDEKTHTITLNGEMICPMNGKNSQFKEVWTKSSADKFVFTWHDNTMTPEMVRTMEITYTRKK